MRRILGSMLVALALGAPLLPARAAVSSLASRSDQIADGATTVFAFAFPVPDKPSVQVQVNGVVQSGGYTVALLSSGSSGGTVTFSVPPADDAVVRIQRVVPLTQGLSLYPGSPFPASSVMAALDRQTYVAQQLERDKASSSGLAAEILARVSGDASTLASAQGYANDAVTGALTGTGAVPLAWSFTGNGSSTQFTLTGATHASAGMYVVALSGVIQVPGTDYSVDLGTGKIVFTTAPANGVPVSVRSFGYARAVNVADTASVTSAATGASKVLPAWMADVESAGARDRAVSALSKIEGIGLRSEKPSAITRKDATTLLAYRPLGGRFWQEIQLTTGSVAGGPYSWNQTRIVEMMSYLLSANAAATYTGTWNDLTSQDPATYMGGRAKWAAYAAGTERVDITATIGGDIYVIFVGRTSGGFVKVEVDGDAEKANALPLHASGYRYIDTYNPVDLTYKSKAKVATGLPYGSHTIRLTVMTDRNAANVSGVSRLYFNGVGFVSRDLGLPQQADTRAAPWKQGVGYGAYDQVQYQGRSYSTLAGGTAGAVPPTHTAGSASDGGVTWLYMSSSSYELDAQYLQAAGSQAEYAYQIRPVAGGVTEDVGGVIHGNETLTSLAIIADGDRASDLSVGAWLSADLIGVEQAITATHTLAGNVATQTLRHEVSTRGVAVAHDHAWLVAADVGWFYSAMWPLLHWSAGTGEYRYAIDKLWTPQAGAFAPASYYGQSNPIVGKRRDFIALAWGDVLMPKGSAGASSGQAGPMTAVAALYVPPESVAEYANAGSVYAGLATNIAGTAAPGFSSVVTKLYFERASLTPLVRVAPGDRWRCMALYLLNLVPSSSFDPATP